MSESIKKIAAVYCVFEDRIYLEYSLKTILGFAHKIIISINHKAWQSGEPLTSRYYDYLQELSRKNRKIEIYKRYIKNQAAQRNYELECLKKQGYDYCFIIDADEFYTPEHLRNIKKIIYSRPDIGLFKIYWRNYWHSFRYTIEPDEPSEPVCCIKIGAADFKISRYAEITDESYNLYTFTKDEAFCHHFSYALSNNEILRKIRRFSASFEILPDWFSNVWLEWEKDHLKQDLHPVHPWHYKKTVENSVSALPQTLQDHPFSNMEIIEDIPYKYSGYKAETINSLLESIKEKVRRYRISKIFIIGPDIYNSEFIQFIESLKYHFEYLGIDAYIYSIIDMKIYFNLRNGTKYNLFLQCDDMNFLLSHLQTELLKFSPDIVIDFFGAADFLNSSIKKYINPISVFWFLNSFQNSSHIWVKTLKKYDFHFTRVSDFPEQLVNSGMHNDFKNIHFGCPVDIVNPAFDISKNIDICFIGDYSDERMNVLKGLQEYSIKVYGRFWEKSNLENISLITYSDDIKNLVNVCNSSKIVICHQNGIQDIERFFLIGGTNTVMLTNFSTFLPVKNCCVAEECLFSSYDELKNKLDFYMSAEKDELLRPTALVNNKIFSEFTMFHTVDFIIDSLI